MTLRYPDSVILVFCKAPVPGQVKTRLIPVLSPEQAAKLHRELATNTLQMATQNALCNVQLWCSPTIDDPFFEEVKQVYPLEIKLQQGADLGARMHQAFCEVLSHYRSAVLIGCDCPSLTNNDLEEVLMALKHNKNCVIAPAEDGGYVLIGLNSPQSDLFETMPWGTSQVLQLTRSRLHNLGIAYQELSSHWDLDTPHDLKRYCALSNANSM